MARILSWVAVLIVSLMAVAPSSAEASTTGRPDEVKDLVQALVKAGDRVPRSRFQQLAAFGTLDAAKGLHKVAGELRRAGTVRQAYLAFAGFVGHPRALEYAIKSLRKDALSHRRETHQLAAAYGLARLGTEAHGALMDVASRSKNGVIRAVAVAPLIRILAERGDEKSIDLLLANAPLTGRTRNEVRDGLAAAVQSAETSEATQALLAEHLESKKTSAAVKGLLLEVLAANPTEESTAAILECLNHESPEVQLAAIEIIGGLGNVAHARRLEALARGKQGVAVRAAIGSLGMILRDEPTFLRKALGWSEDKRPSARMGACLALVHGTDARSSERLRVLIVDEDWRVRAEALGQLALQRRATDIPLLIERLAQEDGRLQSDVAGILRDLTGVDQGTGAKRWSAWWKGEGASFVMPTLEEAKKAAAERAKLAGDGRSAASFYGLSVLSGSVAFVVDVSGSMLTVAKGRAQTRSRGKSPTRLDVAQEQLQQTIEGLAEGVLFNITIFGGRATSWAIKQERMTSKSRASALQFVNEIRAGGGGTNTLAGLMAAFENEEVDTVYLLSDGRPTGGELTNPAEIRQRIRLLNSLRKVRIHCISIGQASPFLRELAEDTGGRYVEAL